MTPGRLPTQVNAFFQHNIFAPATASAQKLSQCPSLTTRIQHELNNVYNRPSFQRETRSAAVGGAGARVASVCGDIWSKRGAPPFFVNVSFASPTLSPTPNNKPFTPL